MAITWASCWTADFGGVFAAGIELSATSSTSGTSTVTVKVYLRACSNSVSGVSTNMTRKVEVTGASSFSTNNPSHGSTSVGAHTLVRTYTYSTSPNTDVTFTARLQLPDVYEGALGWTNKATQSIKTPPAPEPPPPPPPPPMPPTGLTATRVDDNRQTLNWTNRSDEGGSPYRYQTIMRQVVGEESRAKSIAQISASADTYTDTSTLPNKQYVYYVRATSVGGSASSNSVTHDTTPAAPSAPTATRQPNGSIVLTRGTLPAHATHWEVWKGTNSDWDSARTVLLPASTQTWTYTSPPPAARHIFRTTAVTDGPVLTSEPSPSVSVNSEAAPNPPTNLSPNGQAVDRGLPAKVLTWRHSPTDTTPQRKYQVRYRVNGGEWITTPEVTSSVSSHSIPGLNDPGTVEWQVRTWGNHADPSPYSSVAAFPLTTAPAATVVFPEPGSTLTTPSVLVEWDYFQADGSTQQAWEVRVVDADSGEVVTSYVGSGTVTSWQTPPVLENEKTYVFRVAVQSSVGVWSSFAESTASVAFIPPNPPQVVLEWMEDHGYLLVNIEPQDDSVAADTAYLTVERSINGGPFVMLEERLDPQSDYLDWTAPMNGSIAYRVTAWSDPPGFAGVVAETSAFPGDPCDIWLSGGPSFALAARLRYVSEDKTTVGRERVLNTYAGRERPVETSGPLVNKTVSLTIVHVAQHTPVDPRHTVETVDNDNGTVTVRDVTRMVPGGAQASREALEELFTLPGPHLIRGADHYFYGTLSDLVQGNLYFGEASFSITRSDSGTLDQQQAIGAYTGQFLVEVRPGEYQIVGGGVLVETSPGEYRWTP